MTPRLSDLAAYCANLASGAASVTTAPRDKVNLTVRQILRPHGQVETS